MDKYVLFNDRIKEAVLDFRNINRDESVKIVSHNDCDGICSSAILINALNRMSLKYSVNIVQNMDKSIYNEIEEDDCKYFFFTDLGSGSISQIESMPKEKEIFILDHHELEKKSTQKNIHLVNPHCFGIDGSKEISGSGVVYLFTRELDLRNESMAHIAVIGAIGDVQEEGNEFHSLNKNILDTAIKNGRIKRRKELRIFGRETKPLVNILKHMSDPFIPGVHDSESGALALLKEGGINPKKGSKWRMFNDLSIEDEKNLNKAIVKRRLKENLVDDIFGNSYILKNEKVGSPLRDAREFATLLNACGRLKKATIGIGACIGDARSKEKAINQLKMYKREMKKIFNWYKEHENSKSVIKKERFMIINSKDDVPPTMIGTLSSIIAKSGGIEDGIYILSMARSLETKTTKISMRVSGSLSTNQNLRSVLGDIIKRIGGESGGHANAAGGVIPTSKENQFIEESKLSLEKVCLEEKVV